MKKLLEKFEKWRQTKRGLGIFIALEATAAYFFGSLAVDSGSLVDYTMAALLIILLVQDMVAFILLGVRRASKGNKGKKGDE